MARPTVAQPRGRRAHRRRGNAAANLRKFHSLRPRRQEEAVDLFFDLFRPTEDRHVPRRRVTLRGSGAGDPHRRSRVVLRPPTGR